VNSIGSRRGRVGGGHFEGRINHDRVNRQRLHLWRKCKREGPQEWHGVESSLSVHGEGWEGAGTLGPY